MIVHRAVYRRATTVRNMCKQADCVLSSIWCPCYRVSAAAVYTGFLVVCGQTGGGHASGHHRALSRKKKKAIEWRMFSVRALLCAKVIAHFTPFIFCVLSCFWLSTGTGAVITSDNTLFRVAAALVTGYTRHKLVPRLTKKRFRCSTRILLYTIGC